MEVKIKIKNTGFKITLEENGKKHTVKWQREVGGFGEVSGSEFEKLDLTGALIDAIEDLIFPLSDVCSALETENAFLPDEEPITTDGHKLVRGDYFYVVALDISSKCYRPMRGTFPQDWLGTSCCTGYFSRENCEKECEEINKKNKNGKAKS